MSEDKAAGTEQEQVGIIEEYKSFHDLKKEVHEKGLCGSCGGCVSFCSSHELKAIGMVDGTPEYIDEENCLKCGICYFICPQIKLFDEELYEKFAWKPPIGEFKKVLVARSSDKNVVVKATDGGVVTGLLDYLLSNKLIDGAIVSKKTGNPFERVPVVATTAEELLEAAGSDFSDMTHVEELGKYSSYSPTLYALKDLRNTDLARIAVVGTPCQIHTIRKMQILGVLPSHIVKFTIGLFCYENLTFDQRVKQEFETRVGLDLKDVSKMNFKENIIIDMKDGTRHEIPFELVDKMVRPACLACIDFANDFADVSVGGLASPDGYTTTIVRTEVGEKRFEEAVSAGALEIHPMTVQKEWSKERTKILSTIINYAERKRARGLKRLEDLAADSGGN